MTIPGYDAWKTRTPEEDEPKHATSCPCHEDAPEVYECGGVGEHFCSWVEREINGCALVTPKCACPSDEEIAELRAEARADAQND